MRDSGFLFFFLWRCDPSRVMASSFLMFLDHTQRRTTVGRTPLDEWSARRVDLYLTTHNTHNRETSIHPVGFEPMISAGEQPHTYALDRVATETGVSHTLLNKFRWNIVLTVGTESYRGNSSFLIKDFTSTPTVLFVMLYRQCKDINVLQFLTNTVPLSESCCFKHSVGTAQTKWFS